MNNGKICVSVCAETADELIEQIKIAEDVADIIEIRFDCLKKDEIEVFYHEFGNKWKENEKIPFITTFRTKEQGGFRELTQEERDYFWNSGCEIGWADCEEDIIEDSWSWLWFVRICSYHDFSKIPDNLVGIYERLKATNADIIKIAIQTIDISESIAVWKLLERAKGEREDLRKKKINESRELGEKMNITFPPPDLFLEIIPIAMGEAGKWTRILGLAHGAFMTYAALDSGRETAPGQISVKDLIDVYRVKELDENTEVYGIVGNPVSQSVSPYMQNAAFKFHDLNAVYIPFEVKDLDEFIKKFVRVETREVEINLKGFSVTIPHKQAILKHLDLIDEDAEKIGAVNTLKIINGKIHGYNTDAHGFIEPLKKSYGDLKAAKVAVIGNGGAARACVYALKKESAEVTIFARNPVKAESLADEFGVNLIELEKNRFDDFDVLVNATPLGMKGKFESETPISAAQMDGLNLVYDLVYNPFETRLLKEADKANVPKIGGLAMLAAQGMKQFEIWTGKDAPLEEMSRAALRKLK